MPRIKPPIKSWTEVAPRLVDVAHHADVEVVGPLQKGSDMPPAHAGANHGHAQAFGHAVTSSTRAWRTIAR